MSGNIVHGHLNVDVKNNLEIQTQPQSRSWKRRKKCYFPEKIVKSNCINCKRCEEIPTQENGTLSL